MGSKIFIFLGLLLAIVLLISSEVAARDLPEVSTEKKVDANKKSNEVNQYPGGGYGGYPGGGYGGYPGGGYGGSPGGGYGRNRGGRYGRGRGGYGCYYGCCRSNYYGRGCARCCSYAGEAVEAHPEAKPHN